MLYNVDIDFPSKKVVGTTYDFLQKFTQKFKMVDCNILHCLKWKHILHSTSEVLHLRSINYEIGKKVLHVQINFPGAIKK